MTDDPSVGVLMTMRSSGFLRDEEPFPVSSWPSRPPFGSQYPFGHYPLERL